MSRDTHIGRYQLLECIGAGGMGEVHLAHDPLLQRRIAIKLLPDNQAADPLARERLRREALAAAALDHPFICKVFEVGEDLGVIFIAMEYVKGQTLFERMRAGRLPFAEAHRIAGEIAEAIEEAHTAHLIHRDLKPANIMLTSQGRVKVMDFGLAKRAYQPAGNETCTVDSPLTSDGITVGTPDYMSPEQLAGASLDGRSDLFSYGIILCELLLGRHPFRRHTSLGTMAAIVRDPPRLEANGSAELSPGLMVLIRRLLSKSPDERYLSIREVRSDLTSLASPAAPAAEQKSEPSITLIGRDTEREQLSRLLHSAHAGRGSLVLIGGEPGIGKTHLTRAILAEAQKLGCFGVTGHCYEMEGSPPYVPFIETLEYCMRVAPLETFRYAIGESAPEIAKLLPELRRLYPDIPPAIELPPEQQRRFLFNAYREFVERSARLTPLVAVFEDLHWADEATILLLGHLAQSVSSVPLLLIGTYRDVDLDIARPFARSLETWVRDKVATRLSLRRLGLTGVQAMLAALSGKTPPDSLARVVYEETEGNPFFVEEVFQHLSEEGKLFDESGAWRTDVRSGELQVPQGVRLVIGRRLERLCQQARHVLTTAAVMGRSFDLSVLEALEKGQPDEVLNAVEEAERAQLVEPHRVGQEVRYRFVHELVRQTLADSLSLPRRQRLHARIAEAIESVQKAGRDSHASAIAHHLYQAGALADAGKTVAYLMTAARQACVGAAYEDALANAEKAVSLVEAEQHPQEADIHLARATALRSMRRWAEAIEAYKSAIACATDMEDPAKAVEASTQLAYLHLWRADGALAVLVVNNAIHLIGAQPSAMLHRLRLLHAVSLAVIGDMEGSTRELSAAKEIESLLPESCADGFSLMCEARIHFQLAQPVKAEECANEALRRFRAVGDLWGQAEVFEPIAAALSLGRVSEAEVMLPPALARAERVGHEGTIWAYKVFSAERLFCCGELEDADRAIDEADKFGQASSIGWRQLNFILSAGIAFYRGDLDEAERRTRKGLEIERASYVSGQLIGQLFLILVAKGDPEAEAALEIARRHVPVTGRPLSIGACGCLASLLEGFSITGRIEEAASLEAAAEYTVINGPVCVYNRQLLSTAAGIAASAAGNWPRAEEHYRTAIQQADSAPYRTAQPIARLRYAEMLLLRGSGDDRARGRQLLTDALNLFESVGMRWYAQRTRERMFASGGSL